MDLFDLAAKITLDSSGYEKGVAQAASGSSLLEDRMKALQTQYNQAEANIKVLQKALDEYVSETGSATGAGEELAAMLADEQMAAEKAKQEMDQLSNEEEDVGNEADKAGEKASSLGQKLKTAAEVGAAAFAAIGAAAVGAVAAIGKGISAVASYGDNVDKMSQKMGISATAYQEWDAVMQHSGTSMETLKASMKTLATAAEKGNDAFTRLGITQEDIAKMNNEELFSATITALQSVSDETERTYLTGQLLGRGATELGPLLNMTAEETEEMKKRVHELGGVMDDDAVKASAAFMDNMQDLKTSISGIGRKLAADFLPGVNDVLAGFTSLIIGEDGAEESISKGMENIIQNGERITEKIGDIAKQILPALIGVLPDVLSAGLELVKGLGSAIIDNADIVIDAAFEIINSIVETLGDPSGFSAMIDSAFMLIEKLSDGLIENLPVLIPAVVDIILSIAEKLVDPANITMIMGAATDIILALIDGIMIALPDLIARAPEIIMDFVMAMLNMKVQLFIAGVQILMEFILGIASVFENLTANGREIVQKVWDGVKQRIEEAKTWGKDLIQNFISGITSKWQALKDKISGIASGIKSLIGFSEPEEGPLSNFHTYAPDMMALFAKGITDNEGMLRGVVANAFDFSDLTSNSPPSITYSATGGGGGELLQLLRQYLPAIVNRPIVLDSGELVSVTLPMIDEGLGEMSVYAGRANA